MDVKALTNREIQLETLKIMKVIAGICEKEKIVYTLAYGTLIGAIRHDGFIPWDDDLDIHMPRNDFEKFKEYCFTHKEELKPFELFTPETYKSYPYMIPRFCNTEFLLIPHNEKPCGMGTFVDIYPLDGFGNDFKYIRKHSNLAKFPASCYFLCAQTKITPADHKGMFLPKVFLFFLVKIIGKKFFYNKSMKWANMFLFDESEFVAPMRWFYGVDDVFRKDEILRTEFHKFEDCEFRIPVEYDKILKQLYGDYMELPPESKRIGHHFYEIFKKEY